MGGVFSLKLPRAQREVLLALADHAEDNGTGAHPGVARLAWKTDLSESQVQRHLRALEQLGVIEAVAHVHGGRGHATEYSIHLEKAPPKREYTKGRIPASLDGCPHSDDELKGRTVTPPFSRRGRIPALPFETPERVASHPQRVALSDAKGSHLDATPTVLNPSGVNRQQHAREDEDGPGRAVPLPHLLTRVSDDPEDEFVGAFYRGLGQDARTLTRPLLRREWVVARDLIAAGSTPSEAEAFARDVAADDRRRAPVDGLRTFERERLSWRSRRGHVQREGPRFVDRTGQVPDWELPVAVGGGSA